MWGLIVSVPDHCLSFFLETLKTQRFSSTVSFTGLTKYCFIFNILYFHKISKN